MESLIKNLPPLFKDKIDPTWKNLDKSLRQQNFATDMLAKVEDKTKIDRKYLLMGVIFIFAFYLIFGYGANLLCNVLGFVYPAYASFKAIESKKIEDDTQWLTYWVVFAVFNILEFFVDILLYWLPFYYFGKGIILVYLYHPSTCGAQMLYKKFIRPQFLKWQHPVDSTLFKANKLAEKIADDTKLNSYTETLMQEFRNKGE